jgi:RNA polymerase sigma factor (sigma-70 family)
MDTNDSDRRAFEALVVRHQAAVCAIAYAVTRDRARSEELAQEAFLVAWQQARTRAIDGAWICAIARNLARNAARRRTEVAMSRTIEVSAAAGAPDAREALIASEDAERAAAALAVLPERDRDAVVLYYRGDESMAAVADALGISRDAAKQRVHRGRERLRDALATVEATLRATRPGPAFTAAVVGVWVARGGHATAAAAAAAAKPLGRSWIGTAAAAVAAIAVPAVIGVVTPPVENAPRNAKALPSASAPSAPVPSTASLPRTLPARFPLPKRPLAPPSMSAIAIDPASAPSVPGAATTVDFDFMQVPMDDLLRMLADVLEAPILLDMEPARIDIEVHGTPAIDALDDILALAHAQRAEIAALRIVPTGGRTDAAALGGDLVSLDLANAPLDDVIGLLEHPLHMPIGPRRGPDARCPPDEPDCELPDPPPPQPRVSIHVTDVSAGAALELVLAQAKVGFELTTGFVIWPREE